MGRIKEHMLEKRWRWDQAHLRAAYAYAQLSFDPDRKVGCVITKEDSVIACGWNGRPPGEPNDCNDIDGRTHRNVIHAEINAMVNARESLMGATVYCTLSPCLNCAWHLRRSGISRVVYATPYADNAGIQYLHKHGIETEYIDERC